MMSPLIVIRADCQNPETGPRLLGVRDASFNASINSGIHTLLTALGHDGLIGSVSVDPCQDGFTHKEVHVLHDGRYLRTTIGDLSLAASPDLIRFLYRSGMGEMREKGFGLFEIIE
jgi:CRISPR/Cas system endoribonuclease Cas6 (RAMP superfamily)